MNCNSSPSPRSGLEPLRFKLAFNWKLTLLGLLMFPVLLRLGFWQLERAAEKTILHQEIIEQRLLPALTEREFLDRVSTLSEDLQHREIDITGSFDSERFWLLDNRMRHGKVGYEVISPLLMSSGHWLLVNRGWVQAPRLRSELPQLDSQSVEISVQGRLYRPTDNKMVGAGEKSNGWPKRIQKVEPQLLYENLGVSPLVDAIVLMDGASEGAYITDWKVINISPAKHNGYAVQWFGMAGVLVIALIFANSNLASLVSRKK